MAHVLHKPHGRTVALLRVLRAIGPLKPRARPVPRAQQPDGIRRDYYKAILPYTRRAHAAFDVVRDEVVRQLADLRKEQGIRTDAGGQKAKAKALVEQAQRRAANAFDEGDLFQVAEKFGKQTSSFQKAQLDRQTRAAVSVPYSAIEKPTRDLVPEFAARNVELIKTVPERYFSRIQAAVDDAFESGEHPNTLADRLEDIAGISDDDARRIARDQIGKLNGQFNQVRQQALGSTRYIWRTMNDERVRDEHSEREGQSFAWDDPPEDGNPGEPIQCRCYAEPDFSDILGDLEDAPQDDA